MDLPVANQTLKPLHHMGFPECVFFFLLKDHNGHWRRISKTPRGNNSPVHCSATPNLGFAQLLFPFKKFWEDLIVDLLAPPPPLILGFLLQVSTIPCWVENNCLMMKILPPPSSALGILGSSWWSSACLKCVLERTLSISPPSSWHFPLSWLERFPKKPVKILAQSTALTSRIMWSLQMELIFWPEEVVATIHTLNRETTFWTSSSVLMVRRCRGAVGVLCWQSKPIRKGLVNNKSLCQSSYGEMPLSCWYLGRVTIIIKSCQASADSWDPSWDY